MPTRNYTVQFDSDITKLVAGLNQLIGLMHTLHQATRGVHQSLNTIPNLQPHAQNASSLADSFGRIAGMAGGLGAARKMIGEVGDALKEARDDAEKMGEKSFSRRDQAREYANLMGEPGPNDKVMGNIFALGIASGKSYKEAESFGREFLGSAEAATRMGKIRPADIPAISATAALFATRIGLDDTTAGKLAGLIPMQTNLTTDEQGRPLTQQQAVERFAGQLGAVGFGLNAGVGRVSTLTRAEMSGALPAIATGRFKDWAEGAAFIGVASQIAGNERGAGTRVKELDRLLNESQGPLGGFLKEIGVADVQGNYAKLQALKAHIDQAKPQDVQRYLEEHGARNTEEAAAGAFFYENFGLTASRLDEARRQTTHGSETIAANERFKQDPEFQMRQAQARLEFSEEKSGAVMQRLMIGRKNAMARLKGLGLLSQPEQLIADKFTGLGGLTEWLGMPSEMQRRIDDEYIRTLDAEAKSKGLDLEQMGLVDKDITGRRLFRHEMNAMTVGRDINRLEKEHGLNVYGAGTGEELEAKALATGRRTMLQEDSVPAGMAMPTVRVDAPDLRTASGLMVHAGQMMLDSAKWLAHGAGLPDMTPGNNATHRP